MAPEIIATRKVQIRSAAATYFLTSDHWVIRIEDGQTESKPVPEMAGFSKNEFLHNLAHSYLFNAEARFAREAAADPNSNVRAYYSF